jgi:hypothetical protein
MVPALGLRWRWFAADRASKQGWSAGRRLLALAAIYDGGTRSEAARISGVGL